jgi:hypothetical protein
MTEFKMVPVEPTPEIITALYGPALDWPAQDARRRAWAEALAAAQPAPVVKALEWNEYEREGAIDEWDAQAGPFGDFYRIETQFHGFSVERCDGTKLGKYDTPDLAKAAAQTDFETRIRSTLVSPPAPVVKAPFKFARYVDGIRRAEGVTINLAKDLSEAMDAAARLCPEPKTVLVLVSPPAPVGEPVAWRYRYINPSRLKPGPWRVREEPPADEELQPEFYQFVPLYEYSPVTSRQREEALKLAAWCLDEMQGYVKNAPTHAVLGRIEALLRRIAGGA